MVGFEGVTQANRKTIAELAVKHRLPAIYGGREFVEAGGLIFYGPSFTDMYSRFATYVDKIFRVPSLPTCRSSSRPSSSSSSTSKRLRP